MISDVILFLGGWGSTSSNQLYILDGAALPKIVRVSCKTLYTPRFKYGFSATLLSMPDVSPITQVSVVAWFYFIYFILFYFTVFDMILCVFWCKLYSDESVLIDLVCLCRLILEIVSILVENPTLPLPLPLLHYPRLLLPVISLR